MREIRMSGLTRGRVMPSLLYWQFVLRPKVDPFRVKTAEHLNRGIDE